MSHLIDGIAFRDIPSAPGYAASACGKIARVAPVSNGGAVPRVIKQQMQSSGYYRVTLQPVGCRVSYRPVHQLVCEAWSGPRPSIFHQTCHIDGARTNNHAENLCWCSPKENQADRKRHGTHQAGDKNGGSKLSWCDVIEMRKYPPETPCERHSLARSLCVTKACIDDILSCRTWWPMPNGVGTIDDRKYRPSAARVNYGGLHHAGKLSQQQVAEIKRLRDSGETMEKIASKFGVGFQCVSKIIAGKTWKGNGENVVTK